MIKSNFFNFESVACVLKVIGQEPFFFSFKIQSAASVLKVICQKTLFQYRKCCYIRHFFNIESVVSMVKVIGQVPFFQYRNCCYCSESGWYLENDSFVQCRIVLLLCY